ncbi:hypothetical protein POTOM_028668 [Populus tomentosa]|uniref:Uncharacterized protein n=1 Tax=Populus tomentosa TaxID=118781 RepID=A0A8X7ZJJ8_POPTO|nr:hypothetical protein POTOM_028668 [Populus tomentosa]
MLRLIGSLSFLWLLMAISTMAQSPPVLDAGGEPLRSGVEYLADPAVADVAGSLTLVARNGSCPFYVGQESARSGRLAFRSSLHQEILKRLSSLNLQRSLLHFQGFQLAAMLGLIRGLSFICLLMAVSCLAQGLPVLDTDGNPVTRGVEYYVDPAVTDVAGGLTLVTRNGSCPSYVGQVPIGPGNVQGLPVVFSPRNSGETVITENTQFTVAFSAASTCVTDTTWGIGEEDPETTRRLIVIGDEPAIFSISRNQAPGPYTFGYCPECNTPPPCGRPRYGIACILEQNGTRFLTIDGPAFPFSFRRA